MNSYTGGNLGTKYTLRVEYARVGSQTYGLGFVSMLMGVVAAFAQDATKVIVTKQPKTGKYEPVGAF